MMHGPLLSVALIAVFNPNVNSDAIKSHNFSLVTHLNKLNVHQKKTLIWEGVCVKK